MSKMRTTAWLGWMTATLLAFGSSGFCAETVEYEGLIVPFEIVDIGSPSEGIVASVTVDRSSPIEKGQVLVELESSAERATLEKVRNVATFDGEIGLQEARLAFARRYNERVKNLMAIPPHEKDQAETEIVLTEKLLKSARERRTEARLELNRARIALEECQIRSPISGVVVERYVSPGEYVSSQPLMRVAQVDPLRVEVIVPADVFGRIAPGMTATIVPELTLYGEQTATVTIVDKIIDSASNTFGVRLELPNAEGELPAGLKCAVRFPIETSGEEMNDATASISTGQKPH
jgi:RND family efflux transporter MFP subunit